VSTPTSVDLAGGFGRAVRAGAGVDVGVAAPLGSAVGATVAEDSGDGVSVGAASVEGAGSGTATGSTAGEGSAAATAETPDSEIRAAMARALIRRNRISGLDASPVGAAHPRSRPGDSSLSSGMCQVMGSARWSRSRLALVGLRRRRPDLRLGLGDTGQDAGPHVVESHGDVLGRGRDRREL
jgi:hypothetical protein